MQKPFQKPDKLLSQVQFLRSLDLTDEQFYIMVKSVLSWNAVSPSKLPEFVLTWRDDIKTISSRIETRLDGK